MIRASHVQSESQQRFLVDMYYCLNTTVGLETRCTVLWRCWPCITRIDQPGPQVNEGCCGTAPRWARSDNSGPAGGRTEASKREQHLLLVFAINNSREASNTACRAEGGQQCGGAPLMV